MSDRISKLILTAIALGLWANAVVTTVRPTPVVAQVDCDERIATAVQMIAYGTCTNRKLC